MRRGVVAVGTGEGKLRRVAVALGLVASLVCAAPAVAAAGAATAARIGTPPPSAPLSLVLALSAHDAGLEAWALAVSTPGSRYYGQYQSIARLAHRFGAAAGTIDRVVGYMRRIGARDIQVDATGLFVDATLSAGVAQRVFATPLAQYRSVRDGTFIAPARGEAAASSVSLPEPLRGLVKGVVGLDTRPLSSSGPARGTAALRRSRARAAAQPPSGYLGPPAGGRSGCPSALNTGGFMPNQYLTAYGYGPLINAHYFGQNERIALIEIDGFKYNDIQVFAGCFGLPVPELDAFGVGTVHHLLAPGGESTLDLEVLDATVPGLRAIDDYESRSDSADVLRAMTAPLQNPGRKPQVISASLGVCELGLVQSIDSATFKSAEDAMMLAGASGISIMAASGDHGSADCVSGSGRPLHQLWVNYPASSKWVTGVGGTNLLLNPDNTIMQEPVWNDTGVIPGSAGGGGFSAVERRPSYQNGVVNMNARAVPDISGLSDVSPGYAVYCSAPQCTSSDPNPWQVVGGTSAATPLYAGGFALVDEYLRLHHRADLGFANPLLYKLAKSSLGSQIFSDVTFYGNDVGPYFGNGRALGCCTAHVGFDEASGWGSLNMSALALAAQANQPVRIGLSLAPQQPLARHRIVAKMTCEGPCRIGVLGEVDIGSAKAFDVISSLAVLHGAGQKTFVLGLTGGQVSGLRKALRHHKRVTAFMAGVLVDAHDNAVEQTPFALLSIRN